MDDKYISVYNLSAKILKEYKDRHLLFVFFSCLGVFIAMGVFTYFNYSISKEVKEGIQSKAVGDFAHVLYAIFMFGSILAVGIINFAFFNEESVLFKVKYTDYERTELMSATSTFTLKDLDELFVLLEHELNHFTSHHEQLRYNLLMDIFYDKIDDMIEEDSSYERKSNYLNISF